MPGGIANFNCRSLKLQANLNRTEDAYLSIVCGPIPLCDALALQNP
jgi:hypothetical protein